MKLTEIGEFGFIDRVAPLGSVRSEGVVKGIGDDCAVIEIPGPDYLLMTTDLVIEGVHFHRDWGSPEQIGKRALAANISDIAACGGIPRDAFISIAVPHKVEVEWLDALYQGMAELARLHQVNLLGGDTTGSRTDLMINIALTGLVPGSEALFRHTAQAGDIIVVTGPTGESGAGCELLLNKVDLPGDIAQRLIRAHLEPRPHVEEGRLLASSGACTAAIDVSDGLSSDLGHLCADSGLGAVLYEASIPVSPELIAAGSAMGKDPLHWVMHGGEDYVLLAAVRSDALHMLAEQFRSRGLTLTPIGEFVPGRGIVLQRRDGSSTDLARGGWDHFR